MQPESETPYDVVMYPGRAYHEAHPDRLSTMAALYGMSPAPAARCRVLELGCGFGGNLIPMAYQYPDSEFLGIDLGREAIETGGRSVAALALSNIELRHADILEFTAEPASFDYIIAHGVYSWVPAAVRARVLAIFHDNLAPQGVAYVSYNAHPISHLRDIARGIMLFHVRDIADPQQRIAQARAILEFCASASASNSVHGAVLRDQLNRTVSEETNSLRHDLTPLTGLTFEVTREQDRFEFSPVRDSDSTRITGGVKLDPAAEQEPPSWRRTRLPRSSLPGSISTSVCR
jgi:SAM-dependent methyltransferase